MILWFQQKVEILETHGHKIRSVSSEVQAPAVLKMKKYVKPRVHRGVRLCRENIFLRDGHSCQYCSKKLALRDLTLDHVFPLSRGGGTSWENLVSACHPCNRKKGNRTPDEARMPLLSRPERMKWSPAMDVQVKPSENVEPVWMPYLRLMLATGT